MEQRITLPEQHLNDPRELLCQVRNEYAMYAENHQDNLESSNKKAELVAEKMDYIYQDAMESINFTSAQLRRYAKVIGNTSCAAFFGLGDSKDADESWVLQFIDNLKEFAAMAKDMPVSKE